MNRKRLTDAQRLARIAEIIEAVDNRTAAVTQAEMSEIYALAVGALVRREAQTCGTCGSGRLESGSWGPSNLPVCPACGAHHVTVVP